MGEREGERDEIKNNYTIKINGIYKGDTLVYSSSPSIIHLSQARDYVFIFRDTENIINNTIKPLVILKWNQQNESFEETIIPLEGKIKKLAIDEKGNYTYVFTKESGFHFLYTKFGEYELGGKDISAISHLLINGEKITITYTDNSEEITKEITKESIKEQISLREKEVLTILGPTRRNVALSKEEEKEKLEKAKEKVEILKQEIGDLEKQLEKKENEFIGLKQTVAKKLGISYNAEEQEKKREEVISEDDIYQQIDILEEKNKKIKDFISKKEEEIQQFKTNLGVIIKGLKKPTFGNSKKILLEDFQRLKELGFSGEKKKAKLSKKLYDEICELLGIDTKLTSFI
ncbi:hypothetical protein HGA92_01105 [Candidatus Gracilibacteria bacterium]|nr:hypothetical protein [Candidatus Gracilibacteria bacterium]NUJ98793.1 hypothetical protein [Candidatus Gracilibacteria bacterium]